MKYKYNLNKQQYKNIKNTGYNKLVIKEDKLSIIII